MKVAFVGKGGSGKTTASSLVSRFLASQSLPVIAIDADINQHLGRTLGMLKEDAAHIPAMGMEIMRIKEYLRGSNTRILSGSAMIKTTPPGSGSRFIRMNEQNPIYDYFSRDIQGVKLLAVGPFDEDDLGVKCYHSKTGSVELLLNHFIDYKKEYLIVDMTAGADSFSSGLFTRFDITFLVVEPTIKSISVYEQYKQYAKNHQVHIGVIANKIESQDDIDFLQSHVGEDMVAILHQSAFVKKTDRGEVLPIDSLEPENIASVKKIIAVIDGQKKDWGKFYDQAVEFHLKNATSWGNTAAGTDLASQVDEQFSYPE